MYNIYMHIHAEQKVGWLDIQSTVLQERCFNKGN